MIEIRKKIVFVINVLIVLATIFGVSYAYIQKNGADLFVSLKRKKNKNG